MAEIKKKSWKEQFIENYNGKSEEAKEVADFMKANYKGNSYIPWATMERLTYMQDPNAIFETLETENGNIVFSDTLSNENKVVQKGEVVSETVATMMSHFVKVKLKFLGKTFIEEYPIQDQDYSALKVYNQNAVNKALKRALAKVASRATGIGLRLYENKDLQFDAPEEDKKPEVKKTTKTTKTTKPTENDVVTETNTTTQDTKVNDVKEEVKVVEEVKPVTEDKTYSYSKDIEELCGIIKNADKDKMTKVLQSLNVAILRQHGFTLSLEDTDDVLCEKLSHFQDVKVFTKAINNMLG